jgi:hypothetical protein
MPESMPTKVVGLPVEIVLEFFMLRSIRFLAPMLTLGLVAGLAQMARADSAPAHSTAKITGTVTTEDHKPVANAKVILQKAEKVVEQQPAPQADKPQHAHWKYTKVADTKTDENGKFTFKDVAPGEYRVVSGEKGVGMGRTKLLKIKTDKTVTVSITLKPRQHKDK